MFPLQILSSLYLGDSNSLVVAEERGFTHVVTLSDSEVDQSDAFEHKVLELEDDDDGNVLDLLEDALEFIDEAIDGEGKVLVQCDTGSSRSAAVVVAYLCHSMGLDVEEALKVLKQSSPGAQPNDGFMQQLDLFKAMGCEVDEENAGYKRFQLQQTARKYEGQGKYMDESELSAPEDLDTETLAKLIMFQCRKCRRTVATSRNTVDVAEGTGQAAFSFRKRDNKGRSIAKGDMAGEGCLFVLPMRWMTGLYQQSGKLYCPGCEAKVGQFNWAGMQTPSGTWVTPAFSLLKSKLDAFLPAKPALKIVAQPIGGTLGSVDGGKRAGATFTHLVFDCDGVLVDSERASCEALRRSVLEVTGKDVPHEFPVDFYPVLGMDVRSGIAYYNTTVGGGAWDVDAVAAQVLQVKEGHYRELTAAGIAAFSGVRALAVHARTLGIAIGVGSSGSPEKIRHNLTSAGLLDLFEDFHIVSATEVARGKPAPDVYLEVLKRLGCTDPSRAMIIEDAVHGLNAAKAAGCISVGITNSLPREQLSAVAHLVVSKLSELDLSVLKPSGFKVRV